MLGGSMVAECATLSAVRCAGGSCQAEDAPLHSCVMPRFVQPVPGLRNTTPPEPGRPPKWPQQRYIVLLRTHFALGLPPVASIPAHMRTLARMQSGRDARAPFSIWSLCLAEYRVASNACLVHIDGTASPSLHSRDKLLVTSTA